MRRTRWVVGSIVAGAALGACFASTALASYPAGVWVRVESVAFEPSEANATRIQIRGAAMLFDNSTNGPYFGYTAPALGYLYYECPAGKEATCALEWQDVKNNIGTPIETCIGLGDQSIPTGSLRDGGTTPSKPDGYPISMGVLSGFSPCQVLADFLKQQPDGGTSSSSSSSSGGTGSTGTTGTTTNTPTTTATTTATNAGGAKPAEEPPAQSGGGCAVQDGETHGALGAALAMLGLAAAFARAGARRRR